MTSYSNGDLGAVIRVLRNDRGLTQEELGVRAGYGKGAGVSVSRLEKGLLRPVPDRLAGIAFALGLTPTELESKASKRAAETVESGAGGRLGAADGASAGAVPPSSKDLRERAKRVQREVEERTLIVTRLSETFNNQHDRARDQFFMRFVDVASRIDGAPQPEPTEPRDDDSTDVDAVAAYRLKSSSAGVAHVLAGGATGAAAGAAVGSAAAYATFVATASFGTASTGAAISGLSGVAATNATLALLGGGTLAAGGAGVSGGTMVLAGIIAAPTIILLAGGLFWIAKRNRKQQQEFAAKLDEAEAELAATRPGVEALEHVLPLGAEILDYIATHAGHALSRWESQLGSGSVAWGSLGEAEKQRYQDFIDIAAVQITLVTINVESLLAARGNPQAQLVEFAEQVLAHSQSTVKALV